MAGKVVGPERATLLERLLGATRLPYPFAALLFSVALGPIGAIIVSYSTNGNIDLALERTVCLFCTLKLPPLQGGAVLVILTVLIFYLFYMIRYMRVKLSATEQQIKTMLAAGEDTFHNLFGAVAKSWPPVVIGLVMMVLYTLQPLAMKNFTLFGTTPVNIAYVSVAYPIYFVAFATFLWVYFCSIRGLYDLGKGEVKLKPYHLDKMLGVRPIGSLSLSFSFTYFLGLGILILLPLILAPNYPAVGYVVLLSASIGLGLVFFLFPLYAIHQKMLDYKRKMQATISEELGIILQKTSELGGKSSESDLTDIKTALGQLTTVMTADTTKGEINAIPTWPFDASILGKLTAMIVTIACTLLANYIMKYVLGWR